MGAGLANFLGAIQVVTKIAASLFAGALLFDVMLGISMWTSV